MPQFILVRLVPIKPTDGATFTGYLTNLSIRAFDLSFGDTSGGTQIGLAQGAWIPYGGPYVPPFIIGPAFTPATQQILQHYTIYTDQVIPPAPPVVNRDAVATAIIQLTAPPTEFNKSDIRLEIRQSNQLVAYERLDFNVEFQDLPISNNPLTYIPQGDVGPSLVVSGNFKEPAVVVTLPDPAVSLAPFAAFVDLPSDGTPPKFRLLRDAINMVLAQDPGGGATLANSPPLTAAQSHHIAREIVWNRQIAPPPERPNNRRLEDMYTRRPPSGTTDNEERDKIEMDRKQYEASLLGYYALQNANSNRLAQYVFAASAAVWAEQQSANPGRVGFRFPVETGPASAPGTTIRQADVVIENSSGLTLNFQVPAEYFYALSSMLATNVTAEERYRMATDENESRIVASIKAAIDANIVDASRLSALAGPLSGGDPTMTVAPGEGGRFRPSIPVVINAEGVNSAEVVLVTAVTGDVLTITRAQAGTAASAHGAGAVIDAAISLENAARRLVAIGRRLVQRAPLCPLNADVGNLVTAWLSEMGASIDGFWQQFPVALVPGHLDLALTVITQQTVVTTISTALIAAIKAIPVGTTAQLKARTVQQWHAFYLNEVGPSTLAGPLSGGDLTMTVASGEGGRFRPNIPVVINAEGVNPREVVLVTAVNGDVLTITRAQAGTAASAHGAGAVIPGNVALLPDFTNPGMPAERVEAFVRQLRKYFAVQSIAPAPPIAAISHALSIPIAQGDPFAAFLAAASGFTFPVANWNDPVIANVIANALPTVFPGDSNAQAWLHNAMKTLNELLLATEGVVPEPRLRFSLLEALYARGFTSSAQILAQSVSEFEHALTGTVAFPFGSAIWAAAARTAGGSPAGAAPLPSGPFMPINPDGSLINCIPPWHLSPLGPVKYIQDLLATGIGATCEQPAATGDTLGTLIAPRRGTLGDLHATPANVHTRLPLIDIVNENLEALADNGAPGVVYDTNGTTLGGHTLTPAGQEQGVDHASNAHAPNILFTALPEHSSPATPVKKPGAYVKLGGDFSSPLLPYAQPLDISRSYLSAMGTSRYETMRTFREEITEFAINARQEAVDFQRHLWRYPVRIELAVEYLGLSPIEYETLYVNTIDAIRLREMYGFPSDMINGVDWKSIVVRVPEFIKRSGIQYCDFLELWKSKFVEFERDPRAAPVVGRRTTATPDREFPECEPCCPEDLVMRFINPAATEDALRILMVFIRLWRSLKRVRGAGYSFAALRDICMVLGLFQGGTINREFIRQLAAFQMLRDDWQLELGTDRTAALNATGATRTRLLGLWDTPSAPSFDWAVEHLLGRIEDRAEREGAPGRRPGNFGRQRPPEFTKILRRNLDKLSLLSGFDPAASPWHAQPTGTLRFTEILAKIYGSSFTTGELLYLFSADDHLHGDDPFFQQDKNEALDQPFDCPEEGHPYDLWTLRQKLLDVHATDEEAGSLTWTGLASAMRTEFGYEPLGSTDPLAELGGHFFPGMLERASVSVSPQARQYRTSLPATVAGMWNSPHGGPFQYDGAANKLITSLPLRDQDVLVKLNAIEQLTDAERLAVQELYFAPRVELARFSFLFSSLAAAEVALIQEPQEDKRWTYFARAFIEFTRRAHIIAEHLAGHVAHASDNTPVEMDLVWHILRRLFGDENRATTSWEQDNGQPPTFTWAQHLNGAFARGAFARDAFAALTRLTGTGLLGEVKGASGSSWPEVRGPMRAFSPAADEWNAPIPTVIPRLDFALPSAVIKFAVLRNGLALRDSDGLTLAGAEGFTVRWKGVLIIEKSGTYTFFAGAPTPDCEAPDFDICSSNKWRVNLRRGQKTFRLLNYSWADEQAPDRVSGPQSLKRGAYFLDIDFEETSREFDEQAELARARTGFVVKYQGPDTEDCIAELPLERLYRDVSEGMLTSPQTVRRPKANAYLALQYTSSLRDIRRTYQRAFKALLFCHRLRLSARLVTRANVSEIDYMLSSPDRFAGVTYVPGVPYRSHRAYLDFNFFPIGDTYNGDPDRIPPAPLDERATPSVKRRQALFDWFERLYDYTVMREAVQRRTERLVWLCFVEASNQQPADPVPLLMDLGVDMDHASLVLDFHSGVTVDWTRLSDDRWAIRVWRAAAWVRRLLNAFAPMDLAQAHPDDWAASAAAAMGAGNANLTKFYRDGMIGRDKRDKPLRYADIERLNKELRDRARTSLVAYLTGMNRISLPYAPSGSFATSARDLSALLLIDVEAGLCQKASRIEDAATAVRSFVERARLSQEPTFVVTPEFAPAWDKRFATFSVWQPCSRSEQYDENYAEGTEHERALKTEAFPFLASELRGRTFTATHPAGMEYWPGPHWPAPSSLRALQDRQSSYLNQVAQPQNLGLIGRPERHARPSWLAASQRPRSPGQMPPTNAGGVVRLAASASGSISTGSSSTSSPVEPPLWIQAAVRLGTRFLRVAAAGEPPATLSFIPHDTSPSGCCTDCGSVHPPVVDEYYFWLINSEFYDPTDLNSADSTVYQDADWGVVPPDMSSDWHRPDRLPRLLRWPCKPMARLAWCRVHNGEFQTPRSSDDGVYINPGSGEPQLEFVGREEDSLRFRITYAVGNARGFRYDIAPDTAVVVPIQTSPWANDTVYAVGEEAIDTADTTIWKCLTDHKSPQSPTPFAVDRANNPTFWVSATTFLGALPAYPFFLFFAPGAPLEPSLYSTAMAVAGTLRAHCRYEAALKWYELYFSPGTNDLRWATCRTPQRPSPSTVPGTSSVTLLATSSSRTRTDQDPCCNTLVQTELASRQRSIVLAYLETLLQYAQAAMCKPDYAMAQVRLNTLSKFLGERPRTIFAQDDGANPQTVTAFIPRFAPLNPRLMEIYDRHDQLGVLHHCSRNSQLTGGATDGEVSYWGQSAARREWRPVAANCWEDDGCCCPPSPYRFQFLLQRALETAAEVRAFGGELLASFEKGDAEYLAAMRAGHERQLLNLTEEIRQMEFREADWQVQALQKTKQAALARRQYYADLIANGLIPKEQAHQNMTEVSMTTRAAGNIVEGIGQVMNLIPDSTIGTGGLCCTPVAESELPIGTKLGHAFAAAARILHTVSDISSTQASVSLTEGGWDRRQEDWVLQVTVLDIEIQQIERQLLGADRRRDVALRQLNNFVQQKQQSAEVQDFLRDKFTNQGLYLFLEREITALHHQMFDIAWCWSRQAQKAYQLEREFTTQTFLAPNIWDEKQEGQLAGERLITSLRAMEKAYWDQNRREHELMTRLSLRRDFPLAFLQLKVMGVCEMEIPEWRFDRENPGHYMRRIKTVSLTIPAVVGYTGVHCNLTLLSSATRIEPTLLDVEGCCPRDCTCDCCEARRYEIITQDPRIVKCYGAMESIATSTGQNDTGLFELNLRDERYLPFEYAGAVSRWRIELPIETNTFDIESVSDLTLQLSYTARDGGPALRKASWAAASCLLPGGGLCFFDWRQDFAEAWQRFQAPVQVAERADCTRALTLCMRRSMFPFLPGRRPVRMRRVELWFEAQSSEPVRNYEIEFVPGRAYKNDREECCERYFMTCVTSEDWPCLFHGVIEYTFPFLSDEGQVKIGDFIFPQEGVIHRAYFICSYEAGPPERCLPKASTCNSDWNSVA